MRALVYTANEEMTFRDEPEPTCGPGDALVAVDAVGVCGSDLHAYLGHDERRVPPLILGHEAVGTVIEGNHIGQRVAFRIKFLVNRHLFDKFDVTAFCQRIGLAAVEFG